MFILVTPMSLSGAERPRPGVTGHSNSRSDSSSRSSRPKVASLSILRCRWHVCSIFSLLMSLRSRMSCLASCWSCRRMSVWGKRNRKNPLSINWSVNKSCRNLRDDQWCNRVKNSPESTAIQLTDGKFTCYFRSFLQCMSWPSADGVAQLSWR